MATSLDDVLKGVEPPPEPAPEPEEAEAVQEEPTPEGEPEEVQAQEPEPEEKAETPPAKHGKEVPLAALQDVRGKLKEERRRAEELEERLKRLEAAKPEEPAPDFWDDPRKAVRSEVEVVERRMAEMEKQMSSAYLRLSMNQSKMIHKEDFDSTLEAFSQAAQDNPALVDQALASEHPGEYIYNTGKQFALLDTYGGDIMSMRAEIEREVRAQVMKELAGKGNKRQNIPQAITDEPSASAPRSKAESGPTPLENIFLNQR